MMSTKSIPVLNLKARLILKEAMAHLSTSSNTNPTRCKVGPQEPSLASWPDSRAGKIPLQLDRRMGVSSYAIFGILAGGKAHFGGFPEKNSFFVEVHTYVSQQKKPKVPDYPGRVFY